MLKPRVSQELEASATILYLSVEGSREKFYFEAINRKVGFIEGKRLAIWIDAPELDGKGSPPDVLRRALAFHALHAYEKAEHTWLVMDMDSQHVDKLHEILPNVAERGFRLAVSNPCFELWLWLHKHDIVPDKSDCGSLKNAMSGQLDHWNREPNLEWIRAAITRADALPGSKTTPFPENPGTQVGELFRYLGLAPPGTS